MKFLGSKVVLALLLAAAAVSSSVLIQAARSSDIFANRRRQQNFVDPIYAFDDIDAHTVSLTNSIGGGGAANRAKSAETPPKFASATTTIAPAIQAQRPASQRVSSFVAAKKSEQPDSSRSGNQKRASSFEDLVPAPAPKSVASEQQQQPKFEPPITTQPTRAAQYVHDLSIVPLQTQAHKATTTEQKHHWSGLENYYKLLQRQQQQPPAHHSIDQTIYQISQEPAHRDDQIGSSNLPLWLINANNNNNGLQPSSAAAGSGPILLPGYNIGQQPTYRPQSSFSFPLDQRLSYDSGATKGQQQQQQQQQPQQQQQHIATSGQHYPSELPIVQTNVYDRDSNQDLGSMSREELIRRLVKAQTKQQQPQQSQQQQQQQADQQRIRYPLADPTNLAAVAPNQFQPVWDQQRQQERPPWTLRSPDGRVVHQEPAKLQEILEIQRQQQRFRHQQETFGSIYDSARMREQYQEEMYCRARNLVNIRLAPNNSSPTVLLNPDQLSRLSQLRIEPSSSQTQDITVQLSASEFPSHMGLYNGTPGDDNFLCAATWIQDGFALTLATCVDSLSPKILTARFGEWNLNRPNSSTFSSPVKEIIIFPKYNRNHSLEHNLALLRLERPIDFLQVPYASPACQRDSRNSLQRAKSCWTPVRNITLSEYFDAEGEGETKEKKNVAMIELPVKLIADDDAECLRQSGAELFNFNHPNYICSADYRKAAWRAKLNQSDYFGSGIYCNEGGHLSLVSLLHPLGKNSTSAIGYLDLSYYRPWMRSVIFAAA